MARRPSAEETYVKDIAEEGKLYAVEGVIVSSDPTRGEGVLDDGTGTLKFVLDSMIFAERIKEGTFVRLIGRAYLTDDGIVLRAEVVNNLNVGSDMYNRVKRLERRVYHEGGV